MNNCITINEYRNIIIDRCQDCDSLVECMYGEFRFYSYPLCYVSVSLCLDYLDLYF